ncbi:B12-binding domain-containing radical SAM protein [Candidatus Woesearchaeota archaeon]|nr:B12-binding domain-containing radical SAM protein [Candidatus Woesearchaeota archaeon]
MKNKILLICLEVKETPRLYPAFGLMYIADALIKNGYEAKIIHDYASADVFKRIIEEAKDALIVCFTTKTSPRLKPISELSKILKKENKNIIVWGGVHASLTAEDTIKNDFVDFVVIGEGELSMPKLADAVAKNKPYEKIKGIAYKKDGKAFINEQSGFIKNLDEYSPRWELIDLERYLGDEKELVVIESRGCPSRCSYCYNVSFNKRIWRAHSVEFVVNMVNGLKKMHEIRSVAFYSDNFVVNKKRARDIVSELNMPWSAEIRADYFDEYFIMSLRGLKCKRLYIGAESGSDKVLGILKKDVKTSQVERAVKIARENNIEVTCAFMTGIPGEDEKDRNMTIDFIHRLVNEYKVDIDGPKFLNPYPGTEIYNECIKKGWVAPKDTLEWARYSRMTYNLPFLSKKEIKKIKKYQRVIALLVYINSRRTLKNIFLPLKMLLDYRLDNKVTALPIEVYLLQFLLNVRRITR